MLARALLWLLEGRGKLPGTTFGMRLDFLHLLDWLARVLDLLSEEAVKLLISARRPRCSSKLIFYFYLSVYLETGAPDWPGACYLDQVGRKLTEFCLILPLIKERCMPPCLAECLKFRHSLAW